MKKHLDEAGMKILADALRREFPNGFEVNGTTLYLTANGERVSEGIRLPSGGYDGGESYGSVLKLLNGMNSNEVTVLDSAASAELLFSVTSVDSDSGEQTGDISCSWYVNDTRVAVRTVAQGINSFDIRKYLTGRADTVKLTVSDIYGSSRSIIWNVTVTGYSLAWNLGELANHNSDSLAIRLTPTGEGDKRVKVSLDGEIVYNEVITTSGLTITTSVAAQSHGAHELLAWIEANAGGEDISTEPLRHIGIWTQSGMTTPIVAVADNNPTVTQYSTANIRYLVYDPVNEPAAAQLLVGGAVVNTLTDVDRSEQTWAYLASQLGEKMLTIRCGETEATVNLLVTAIGYDIKPVTAGLVLDFDPAGHSNIENGYDSFGYTDASGNNHPIAFSEGFDWINGGFQIDDEGVTAFVVKRGDYVTFDRSLFDDNARINGKEIKLIFKVTNCRDYDAEILSCVSGGVGLKLQAQQAVLSSELSSTTILYCEDSKIEMDINIESDSEDSIATIWLSGVPSRAFAFSDSDSWTQTSPQMLTIGSAEADVWIYRLKMHENSLGRRDIIANYIADCADTGEMIDRYERNDIFDSTGNVSISKLMLASPELRIIEISAEKMTVSKTDEVPCSVKLTYPNGGSEYSFTAAGVIMKAQGTSSMDYIDAGLNLDLDFSGAEWTDGNGETITEYAMTPGSVPVDYFNIKVNIASSENANNVVLADDYNAYQPNVTMVRASNSKVRDTVEGHPCAVFFTNTSAESITINNGARTVGAGETVLYACGDMNNSKKNFEVFGQNRTEYPICAALRFSTMSMRPACIRPKCPTPRHGTETRIPRISSSVSRRSRPMRIKTDGVRL